MGRQVYIYCDEGCSKESVKGWVTTLTQVVGHPERAMHIVNCKQLLDGITRQCASETALIMPGGADLGFVRLLSGKPVRTIQRVVKEGGSYIGTCAGAYFASSACVFERDDERLRVVGERELCLFPYPAVGAVRENFCYGSEAGATVERLTCEWEGERFESEVYCNGGPGWDVWDTDSSRVVARYGEAVLARHGIGSKSPAAVVAHKYGEGRVVVSGVHPELDGGESWGRRKLVMTMACAARL